MTTTDDALRAWAQGSYPLEAGVELLIRHGKAVHDAAPWIKTTTSPGGRVTAAVDVDALLQHAGAWSGGEQRIVRIAASLLGGPPVDLAEDVTGLDRTHMALVLAALAHANGSHEHSGITYDQAGHPAGFERLSTLYPWPEGRS